MLADKQWCLTDHGVLHQTPGQNREESHSEGSDVKYQQSQKFRERMVLNLDRVSVVFFTVFLNGGTVGYLWSEGGRTQIVLA